MILFSQPCQEMAFEGNLLYSLPRQRSRPERKMCPYSQFTLPFMTSRTLQEPCSFQLKLTQSYVHSYGNSQVFDHQNFEG